MNITWVENLVRAVSADEGDDWEGDGHDEEAEADGGHGQGEGLQVHLQQRGHVAHRQRGRARGGQRHHGLEAAEDGEHVAEPRVRDLRLREVHQSSTGPQAEQPGHLCPRTTNESTLSSLHCTATHRQHDARHEEGSEEAAVDVEHGAEHRAQGEAQAEGGVHHRVNHAGVVWEAAKISIFSTFAINYR